MSWSVVFVDKDGDLHPCLVICCGNDSVKTICKLCGCFWGNAILVFVFPKADAKVRV